MALPNMDSERQGQTAGSHAPEGPASAQPSPLLRVCEFSQDSGPGIADQGEDSVLGSEAQSWDLGIRSLGWVQTPRFPQVGQPPRAALATDVWPLRPPLEFRAGPGAPPQAQSSVTKVGGSVSGTAVDLGHPMMTTPLTEHVLYARLC